MTDSIKLLHNYLDHVSIPGKNSKVCKDECVVSFDTPFTKSGLYVCLKTFLGVGKDHLMSHAARYDSHVYLRIKKDKVWVDLPASQEEPSKLAIGISGGFDVNTKKFTVSEEYSIIVLPEFAEIPWPNEDIPDKIKASVVAVLAAESIDQVLELQGCAAWDGELRLVSRYAENLVQLDNNKKIPTSGWKCEKCELTNNLWLNLTDGSIHCGRKYFDGTGGNDHAVQHYNETKYPLAVKLGTITPDGKADVYSYAEDDMVEDPFLATHLSHFGINIMNLEKTDKSMIELELDLNKKFGEWASIQEEGSTLTPLYGPGYTGLQNLGNSCYINSTVQVLFSIPPFVDAYYSKRNNILEQEFDNDPLNNFNLQMCKLAYGLLSGKYSERPEKEGDAPCNSIAPRMFRVVSCKNSQFANKQQQDAQEYLLHLLDLVQNQRPADGDPTDMFKFRVQDKIKCASTNKVQFLLRDEYCIPLNIPMEMAINKEEVAQSKLNRERHIKEKLQGDAPPEVRSIVPFEHLMTALLQEEVIDDFYSSALRSRTRGLKSTRLASLPRYLFVQLKKYTLKEDWTPIKLDVSVQMPDELDLSAMKATFLEPGEEMMPEEEPPVVLPVSAEDELMITQLMDMGFSRALCARAVSAAGMNGVEDALNWVMAHMDDALPPDPVSEDNFVVDEMALATVMSMGFPEDRARRSLKESANSVDQAINWLFSNTGEQSGEPMEQGWSEHDIKIPLRESILFNIQINNQTPSKYRLKAFISHMGSSTAVGHYVCHIFKEGRWVIYNDEKVAISENPPKDLGYVYLYERL